MTTERLTDVVVPPELAHATRELAKSQNIPISEVVRRGLSIVTGVECAPVLRGRLSHAAAPNETAA